jgi:hypothetical protein
LKRVEKVGDLYEPVLGLQQRLPKLEGLEDTQSEVGEAGLEIAAKADGAKHKPTQRKSRRRTKV